ncbi:L-threonine O-3-phosphate decarboxylase [uncultured Desulfobacterium sp.]|uniref:threonine-phosphate decarboxylase n=1 Tax=uncultured Desulfobacterium sp. TaxID=201089 RepID=A0A445N2F9_9BACT|nr:L-threonine O-3-phosphate decarboxylase [uncultured Desulfobacterium sp.]
MRLAGACYGLLYRLGLGVVMNKDNAYVHGGNPVKDMARLGVAARPVLDFSVNLNPSGSPPIIRDKWQELFSAIEGYPSVEGTGIARYYQEKFNIAHENILAGNGSTEMIYLLPRALGLKRVVIITPSYHDYERASFLAGAKVSRHPLISDDGFSKLRADQLITALKSADALWLGRPNNPTGTLPDKGFILEIASQFPEKWVIIDEAFIQFVEDWRDESFITGKSLPNIIVIHSLTKIYALAGIRMGALVANSDVISRIKKVKEPWSVNGMAERIAPMLLDCDDYERKSCLEVSTERSRVMRLLQKINGINPVSSAANFILCQWTRTGNLDDLLRHLLFNGAYVRDCRNFPGLEKNYFRVGLRKEKDNDRLLNILSAFRDNPV